MQLDASQKSTVRLTVWRAMTGRGTKGSRFFLADENGQGASAADLAQLADLPATILSASQSSNGSGTCRILKIGPLVNNTVTVQASAEDKRWTTGADYRLVEGRNGWYVKEITNSFCATHE